MKDFLSAVLPLKFKKPNHDKAEKKEEKEKKMSVICLFWGTIERSRPEIVYKPVMLITYFKSSLEEKSASSLSFLFEIKWR